MARVSGVQHVAVTVDDLASALEFYVGLLGLEVLPRPDLPFEFAWLRAGAQEVHVGVGEPNPSRRNHFALEVEDIDGFVARLEAGGVEVFRVDPPIVGAGRQAIVRDPAGNMVELNEPDAASRALRA